MLCAEFIGSTLALPLLIVLARMATKLRLRYDMPRSLWASTPIITLPILAQCDRALGLQSFSLVYTTYHTSSNFDINLKQASDWVIAKCPRCYHLFTWIIFAYALLRYDIFHFFCDRGILLPEGRIGLSQREMDILRKTGKRLYTYTYGADVRTQLQTRALGEFNFCMDCPEPGKFCTCDDTVGKANITRIRHYATAMCAMGDMTAYVPDCTNLHYWPLDLGAFRYVGVDLGHTRPLRIAHAPNHGFFKGSSYLEAAVSRLQAENYAVELVRVQGVSNDQVINLFSGADIVAEQFIGGFHGYTALEAMALGKAVISYVRSPDLLINSDECPILNATPNSLYQILRDILAGKHNLSELGRRGREYVEKYYRIDAVSARLARLYIESAGFPERIQNLLQDQISRLDKLESVRLKANLQ